MINDDFNVLPGKRKFVKISIDELKSKLGDKGIPLISEEYNDIITKDFKYKFCDWEYYTSDEEEIGGKTLSELSNGWVGFHTLSNGLTFHGTVALAQDGGMAVFYITYFDGKNIRVYMPTRGNLVNTDCKTILGNELIRLFELGNGFDEKKALKLANKYLKENRLYVFGKGRINSLSEIPSYPWEDERDYESVDWGTSYAAKYIEIENSDSPDYHPKFTLEDEVDIENLFDWEAMKEEILTHFVEK